MKKIPTILVVIIIAVAGVVAYFTYEQESKQPFQQATQVPTKTTQPNPSLKSGIIIQSPQSNEIVKLPVTVIGYVNGNGWYGLEGEVGNVQVLDANGKVISAVVPLTATTDWMKTPTYFNVQVGDRQMMSYIETSTGFLLFKSSAAKDGEVVKQFRLPIKFR